MSDSDSMSKITPEITFRFPTTNTNPLFADLCNCLMQKNLQILIRNIFS